MIDPDHPPRLPGSATQRSPLASYEAQVQVVGLEGVGFNLRMGRPGQLVAALAVSVRNPEIRRVELAWGRRSRRSGRTSSRSASSPTSRRRVGGRDRGTRSVAARGARRALCSVFRRPLPARALPPHDHARRVARARRARPRRPLRMRSVLVFAFAALSGSHPRSSGRHCRPCAVARAHSRGADCIERCDLDDREPGNTLRPACRRRARLGRGRRARVPRRRRQPLLVAALLLARGSRSRAASTCSAGRATPWRALAAAVSGGRERPTPRLVVGLIVAQTFVRGCLNVLIVVAVFQVFEGGVGGRLYDGRIGVGGLIGAFGALTLGGRRLAVPSASRSSSGDSRSC